MNTSDLRLVFVRLISVKGTAFGPKDEGQNESQLRAAFGSKVSSSLDGLKTGDSFEVHLNFKATIDDSEEAAFEAEVCGEFMILNDSVLKELETDSGAYQAATMIFPYLRNFSKPILEALGTANIEFPFYLPSPPKAQAKQKRTRASRKAKPASTASE